MLPVSGNQVSLSLTCDKAMYDGTLDDCIAHKRMVMSWSPLGSYFKEDTEQVNRIKEVMAPLEAKYNASADQLLLAWLFKHPGGVHPVVGTTDPKRLAASLQEADIHLELEDWFILLEASQGHKVP
jgi:predicted oxidoreductase